MSKRAFSRIGARRLTASVGGKCSVCGLTTVSAHMTMNTTFADRSTDMPALDLCPLHFMQVARLVMDMMADPGAAARMTPRDLHPNWPDSWDGWPGEANFPGR